MAARHRLYVGGDWVTPAGTGTIAVVDPTTESQLATVPDATPADVDRAVRAARLAFAPWSEVPVGERARLVAALADGIEARTDGLADLLARELGMPLPQCGPVQVGLALAALRSMVEVAASFPFEEPAGESCLVREPVGVVAAITPWNYPLYQVAAKVAPALAAGCTVVLKPSEVTPLNAFVLAEVAEEVGLPPGVLNLVTGTGPVVGEALASHPEVDMVSLTGSTRAGRRASELAAATVKRVTLELGGKSAAVVLDDADLGRAVPGVVASAYANCGQACSAQTRLLVPRPALGEAEEAAVRAASSYVPGDPFAPGTTLGPLVSATQRQRVRGLVRAGVDEGARLLTGGTEPPPGLERGWFVRPTVFSGVAPAMTVAQQEIFGPVLSILPYDGEDQAVEIANGTVYGLSGGVWSAELERARQVARRLRTGHVLLNGSPFTPEAPFGGYRQSGNGRELGRPGLEEYLELKWIQA
ncbi:MAG: aldehyde dehydrogenase family protein [Acidimicrobiales bacterium]